MLSLATLVGARDLITAKRNGLASASARLIACVVASRQMVLSIVGYELSCGLGVSDTTNRYTIVVAPTVTAATRTAAPAISAPLGIAAKRRVLRSREGVEAFTATQSRQDYRSPNGEARCDQAAGPAGRLNTR